MRLSILKPPFKGSIILNVMNYSSPIYNSVFYFSFILVILRLYYSILNCSLPKNATDCGPILFSQNTLTVHVLSLEGTSIFQKLGMVGPFVKTFLILLYTRDVQAFINIAIGKFLHTETMWEVIFPTSFIDMTGGFNKFPFPGETVIFNFTSIVRPIVHDENTIIPNNFSLLVGCFENRSVLKNDIAYPVWPSIFPLAGIVDWIWQQVIWILFFSSSFQALLNICIWRYLRISGISEKIWLMLQGTSYFTFSGYA